MPKPLAGLLLVFLPALSTNAQDPLGPQFQINTYTSSSQEKPKVALGAEGSFMVVWSSSGSSGTDTFFTSVQGQRFSSDGSAVGAEFQINTYTTSSQERPAMAVMDNGTTLVVWDSNGSTGSDPGVSVQGQRLAFDGTALGLEFQANVYTTSSQINAEVVVLPSSDLLLFWESQGSSGADQSGMSIQGRYFSSDGSPQGDEFQVNSYSTDFQRYPAAAVAPDGSFVVVWESDGSSSTDNSFYSIQGQRFDPSGQPLDAEFQVNTTLGLSQVDASIAMAPDDDFMVVWSSHGSSGTDTWGYSIQGQRYGSDGLTQGSEFQINTYTTMDQRNPVVKANSRGEFVVVWQSYGSLGSDVEGHSLQAQRLDADGTKIGDQFQVNSYTTSDQFYPTLDLIEDRGFVIAWQSDGSSESDQASESIQGQRFRWVIFGDGFESGDWTAWSATSP